MADKKLEDFTEREFSDFINKIRKVDFPSERAHSEAVGEFARLTEHPSGWYLIYHREQGADNTTQGIIGTIKKWRAVNGKPGFKAG